MDQYTAVNTAIFSSGGGFLGIQNGVGAYEADSGSFWTVDTTVNALSGPFDGTSFTYTGFVTVNGTDYPVVVDGGQSFVLAEDVLQDSDFAGGLPTLHPETFAACFLEGTPIAVPGGEVAVESLSIGDMVQTLDGDAVAVKWIGRKTVHTLFQCSERDRLICIARGALGPGVPHTDLKVTADHAILLDGVLCNAGALVNGQTIWRVPPAQLGRSFVVYHIETTAHDIILAAGVPAETFIDSRARRSFENYDEYAALYGCGSETCELGFARAMSARQVPSWVHERLRPDLTA